MVLFDILNSFLDLSSVDSLDLNLSPYMKAPEQQYNNYPTLTKDSPSDSIQNTYGASSENDLLSGTENSNKKKTNKRRKINKSKRRKIKRRPQKQRVIQEVIVKTFDTFIKTVIRKKVNQKFTHLYKFGSNF